MTAKQGNKLIRDWRKHQQALLRLMINGNGRDRYHGFYNLSRQLVEAEIVFGDLVEKAVNEHRKPAQPQEKTP